MITKHTTQLLNELQFKNQSIQDYIDTNSNSFIEINLYEFWHSLVKKSGMTKSDIINKSDFGYVYFYDVINGKKIPSRDKIIKLFFAMHLSLNECQQALKYCGRSMLYPRVKRDSIFIFGLTHGLSLFQVSELLQQQGEADIK